MTRTNRLTGALGLGDKAPTTGQKIKVSLRAERSNPCPLDQRLLRRLRLLAMTCSPPLLLCSSKGFVSRSLLALLLVVAAAPYISDVAMGQAGRVPVAVQDFENQGGGSARWDFLKRVDGPSSDPISNGLIDRLTTALEKTDTIAVAKTFRGPKVPGFPSDPGSAPGAPIALETPRFIVSCSATMNGDIVTIEVRLVDPQTKKLIKATTVEGRPEDLQQEIGGLLGARQETDPVGHESVAEQTLRAAIMKAATWIGVNTLESVMVKAVATKVKEGPSLQSATLATVRQGTVLKKVGQEGEWIRVRLENGEMGWVYRELVE